MIQRATWMVCLLLSACAPAQRPPAPAAATSAVYTADGRILGVERRSEGGPTYVHLIFQPAAEQPIRIELAPGWYLDEKGARFAEDDLVRVEGQRMVREGQPLVQARSVRRGPTTIQLRDSQNRPLWRK